MRILFLSQPLTTQQRQNMRAKYNSDDEVNLRLTRPSGRAVVAGSSYSFLVLFGERFARLLSVNLYGHTPLHAICKVATVYAPGQK